MLMKRLQGKVAIVAGGGTKGDGTGNGRAVAIKFAREGALVLCVDKEKASAISTVEAIRKEGGHAESYEGDITRTEVCKDIIETCVKRFGKLNVLHNNAGILCRKEIIDTPEEVWNEIFDLNVKGMFIMCKYAIPAMKEAGGGSIINVSSLASMRGFPDAAYCSSKGAVNSLTLYVAGRYSRYNIRANALLLGYIDTPLARSGWEKERVREQNLKQVPMRRFGSPWEVANVAAFLASDEASYITGAILPVDGGLSISM
jgi:NAD(P)-dependent dehydrogenase (short-subunit alcohol dehydrogenase family)